MAGVFGRSWEITKMSFRVIGQDKELLLFPLLSSIFSLAFIFAMIFPSIFAMIGQSNINLEMTQYVLIFLAYLGLAFIATFFNVCTVYTTKKRFEGGNATFGESISYGFTKIHLIFSWSLVAATVGLILRIIDRMAERSGQVGRIIIGILNSILGMVWSIITIFVVPAMVYHDLGPIDAIKKSVETIKRTWGESLVRYYGLGLVQMVFIIIGAIITIPLVIFSFSFGGYGWVVVLGIAILYFVVVSLVFAVANQIFNVALYVYADTGQIPTGYTQEIMSNAFSRKSNNPIGGGVI